MNDSKTNEATLQALLADITALSAVVENQRQRLDTLQNPADRPRPTSRRRAIGRLGQLLMAGAATLTVWPQAAQARMINNYSSGNSSVGAVILPPGGTLSGQLPTGRAFGLVVSSPNTLNLADLPGDTNAGLAIISSQKYALYGRSINSYGIYGSSISQNGITANVTNDYGAFAGVGNAAPGIECSSTTGVPIRIVASSQLSNTQLDSVTSINVSSNDKHLYVLVGNQQRQVVQV